MRARELTLLLEGNVEVVGRIVRSSNAAFVIEVSAGEDSGWAVYKPEAGEKPLFDFEPGLYRRERAAFLLSEHLGWDLVPFTVIREDAPLGIGSFQWFIDGDVREHYFTLYDEVPETHSTLAQLALFDCIANNADRKSGHVLRGLDGRVWGIDHRLCFSSDFKLRTVIWEFAGDPMAKPPLEDIAPLADSSPAEIAELLDPVEATALRRRVQHLLREGTLPVDRTGMRFPWPLV